MHLTTDQLVDIAEGTRPEASAPHLAACEPCRLQLQDLHATLSAAREVGVPEPSPLFWEHLSARVSEAVAADARLKGSRSFPGEIVAACAALFGARAFQASAVAAAALLLIVVLNHQRTTPPVALAPGLAAANAAPRELLRDVASADDDPLTLVATLTDDADADTVREAGLASRGSAEHAVTHMSDTELRELGRLLKEEMARSGA